MRKFYVAYYNESDDIVMTTTIHLDSAEKANDITFLTKINEKYINNISMHFCTQVISWSLIEE